MGYQRYVSSELAHFVGRNLDPDSQYRLLAKILNEGWITHPPHDLSHNGNLFVDETKAMHDNSMFVPQIVCFCDIPSGDLNIHTKKYSSFGVSFSKDFVARQGGCPVFYVPKYAIAREGYRSSPIHTPDKSNPAPTPEESAPVDLGELFSKLTPECLGLLRDYEKAASASRPSGLIRSELWDFYQELSARHFDVERFLCFRLFSFVKLFDHSAPDEDPENYYMEREWRVIGNVHFAHSDVQRIYIPRDFSSQFRSDFPDFTGQITFVE